MLGQRVLLNPIRQANFYEQLIQSLEHKSGPIIIQGLLEGQKAHLAYGIFEDLKKQICIITYTEMEARQIYEDLKYYIEDKVLFFPKKDLMFYNIETITEESNEERAKTIEKLLTKGPYVVVTTVDALLLKLPPPELYNKYQLAFKVGDKIDLDDMLETFVIQGYEPAEMVETRGEFSVRGGIIDIYPSTEENPIRIELFDDEVDSIRYFEVGTQKSISKSMEAKVYPMSQSIIDPKDKDKIVEEINKELVKRLKTLPDEKKESLQKKINYYIEKIQNSASFKGMEVLYPYVDSKGSSLLDYLATDAAVILDEPNRLKQMANDIIENFREGFKSLLEAGEVLPKQGEVLFSYEDILESSQRFPMAIHSLLPQNMAIPYKGIYPVLTRPGQMFHGKIDMFISELKQLMKRNYSVVILLATNERALSILEEVRSNGIRSNYIVSDNDNIDPSAVNLMLGNLNKGFEYVEQKLMVLTDYEIFGVHKRKKQNKRLKNTAPIKSFIDLQVGNFVVHEGHGIGKYEGIEQLRVEGVKKDYLKISYAGQDNLYVPTDQMDLIQKYIGSEERTPKLNKLGGTEWAKTKVKVKKAIVDMAEDLLKLYAKRQEMKGYAFSEDTDWQRQFEYMFPYEETPDQLKSIDDVKRDMESDRPMDRLLCGDVGYGKTEVAIRAAFKCVMDGKQVAFLVPTTILAQQHYNNFRQRFNDFPVRVEMLSRFKTPMQQKKILEEAQDNQVDIIIGTHRILSKDLKFKNLGLLIVDEEQRFGVKHKEVLKQLKQSIDVLTLTATPIPRTLHMSLVGIRDMSVIEDPPEERYPVQTYVSPYNEALIIDAITREVNRGGQAFYVYNRVQGIHRIANHIMELMPRVRVAVGHGQMSERQLEKLMMDFYHGEYDVLVSTTIIETGLDIPNVNTIIIHDADRLGLSQLYQLRGRVGRSNRQSYAYLMFERDKVLSETAEKRLKAIKEFTEFGSGFKIAMRDLEIRGSGNLLGAEQHGHMAAIGYDLYVKLLEETMAELKGEKIDRYEDTVIEINVDAYISTKYIKNQNHKIEIYKKIALIRSIQDMYDIEEEIEDRFGEIPLSVSNLLLISYIKAAGQSIRVQSISQKDKEITIQFKDLSKISLEDISEVLNKYKFKLSFHATEQPYFVYTIKTLDHQVILKEIKDIIEKISGLQVK